MSRVLVVDDDLDIQLLLRLELSADGHDVVTADNGRQALEMIELEQPELVLLDVMMPILDGWGVLDELDDDGPVVIMVSAFTSDRGSVVERALRKGAFDFVQKPFDPGDLNDLVSRALSMDAEARAADRNARLASL